MHSPVQTLRLNNNVRRHYAYADFTSHHAQNPNNQTNKTMTTITRLIGAALLIITASQVSAQPVFPTARVVIFSTCDPSNDVWVARTAIAPDGQHACLVLDGTGSTGSGGDLRYQWYVGPSGELISTNAQAAVCLPLGETDVAFGVGEGELGRFTKRLITVITPEAALDRLGAAVVGAGLSPRLSRTLLGPLERADVSLAHDHPARAVRWLEFFQKAVHRSLSRQRPQLATELSASAQRIINALDCLDDR